LPNYKLYFVDGAGHIHNRMDIEANDDAAAVAKAEDLAKGQALELWQSARIVKKISARSAPAQP
jgi:hypothetical protein